MKIDFKISHQDIKGYLQGNLDNSRQKYLHQIRGDDPLYHLFFRVIDKVKGLADSTGSQDQQDSEMSFETMEDILVDIMGGQIQTGQEGRQFANELLNSPVFYERLLLKLSQITPMLDKEDVAEISTEAIKSSDEILTRAGIISPQEIGGNKQGEPGYREKRRWIPGLLDQIPQYVFVLAVLVIASLAVFFVYKNFEGQSPIAEFRYENKVPYEFARSSLRQPSERLAADSLAQSFISQFRRGMSEYVQYRYEDAISILEPLISPANQLLTQSPHEEILLWVRDLYFYLGVSYFALSTKEGITAEVKTRRSPKALQFLADAEALVSEHNLADGYREIYFLGLAHGKAGNIEAALEKLNQIKPESEYYLDSMKLIQEWSN